MPGGIGFEVKSVCLHCTDTDRQTLGRASGMYKSYKHLKGNWLVNVENSCIGVHVNFVLDTHTRALF